ncbi:Glycerophosphocholine phosphodiesterase [Irineochytrium annulatum]|nr:Glycerophosphocholine phosphodiesterase [Irineochytrium annulatum]
MHAILLTLGSQDMRITTPPVQLMDPATAALPLLLTVEIAGAGTLGEKHSMELPSRSSTSGTELHFHTKDLATASFRFNIVTKTSFALKATANTGPLSLSRPVSLWNEREPLGGRAHLPFIDLVTGAVFAMLMFEFVVVTEVIGHRGAGKNAPIRDRGNLQVGENTILSFMTAGKLGAEYIEFGALE